MVVWFPKDLSRTRISHLPNCEELFSPGIAMYIVYMRLNTPHRRNLITRLNYVSLHVQLRKVNANTDRIYAYTCIFRLRMSASVAKTKRQKRTGEPIHVLRVNEILVPYLSFLFSTITSLLFFFLLLWLILGDNRTDRSRLIVHFCKVTNVAWATTLLNKYLRNQIDIHCDRNWRNSAYFVPDVNGYRLELLVWNTHSLRILRINNKKIGI